MFKFPILLFVILCLIGFKSSGQITLETTTVDTSTVINNVDVPWEIIWGPDDYIWMTERFGRVSRLDPESGVQDVILDIKGQVYENGEAGLLGMALHPDFDNSPHVFLVYTYQSGSNLRERMVRYEYNGIALVNPLTLIEDIPANTTHDGSRLLILPDETIIMTTGDAQNQNLPQDVNSLNGKILRFNLDGSIPMDNPIAMSPVWSWGHRNPQGLVLAPNGKLYSSEHGPTTDDELNIITKGGNYGWPNVHGLCDSPSEMTFCNDSSVVEPILNWTPTIATSDILWYESEAIPEFTNTILLAVLKDKRIISIKLDASGEQVVEQKDYFINTWGRIRDICVAPSGDIYLATNGQNWSNNNPFHHSIIKVTNSNFNSGLMSNSSSDIYYWPNPANEILNLRLPFNSKAKSIVIKDLSGKIMMRVPIPGYIIHLDISELSGGTYLLETEGGNNTFQELIIVY